MGRRTVSQSAYFKLYPVLGEVLTALQVYYKIILSSTIPGAWGSTDRSTGCLLLTVIPEKGGPQGSGIFHVLVVVICCFPRPRRERVPAGQVRGYIKNSRFGEGPRSGGEGALFAVRRSSLKYNCHAGLVSASQPYLSLFAIVVKMPAT